MCFSNLPVEFDEEGNPYLADEAEAVERPDEHAHGADCGCGAEADLDLSSDPEGAYEAIVESLPEGARSHVEGSDDRPTAEPAAGHGPAEGD